MILSTLFYYLMNLCYNCVGVLVVPYQRECHYLVS